MNKRPKKEKPTKNRFERRKERTRRSLKDATLALVLEYGYDEVSIQDIVDEADLGRGTFYVHYKDKQDILWDILQDGLQASLDEGKRRSEAGNAYPGYTGYLITFETAAQYQDLYRVMLGSKGSSLITHRVVDFLAASMQAGIESGGYLDEFDQPPPILAQFVMGALMRLTLWWLETPNAYTPKEMADMFYTIVHKGPSPN